MIRIALPVYLFLLLLTTSPSSSGQGLSPSTPSKDYIRQGGALIAIETPAAVVQFAPAALSFGNVILGATSGSQSVTLTNGGTKAAPVTISAVALGGANPLRVALRGRLIEHRQHFLCRHNLNYENEILVAAAITGYCN